MVSGGTDPEPRVVASGRPTGRAKARREEIHPHVSLDAAIAALVASAPFERILLARERPVLARADAGADAAVAALATALDTAIMLVAPGPREAEQLTGLLRGQIGNDHAAGARFDEARAELLGAP